MGHSEDLFLKRIGDYLEKIWYKTNDLIFQDEGHF